jgi:hypothetical protein
MTNAPVSSQLIAIAVAATLALSLSAASAYANDYACATSFEHQPGYDGSQMWTPSYPSHTVTTLKPTEDGQAIAEAFGWVESPIYDYFPCSNVLGTCNPNMWTGDVYLDSWMLGTSSSMFGWFYF